MPKNAGFSRCRFERWGERECTYWGGAPGERVRKKISDANRQLKNSGEGLNPTILLLANFTAYEEVCDHQAMSVAMFGDEYALISSEVAPEGGAKVLKRWHGGNKRMTRAHSRSISAVGCMDQRDGIVALRLYHNPFAQVPLDTSFGGRNVLNFVAEADPERQFVRWKPSNCAAC
ncbi:MAG TPA: hypothetical protein VEB66_18180 [Opitutaceae bacterium]|nr:hypothetical protein [Opitutaceae bacterium]